MLDLNNSKEVEKIIQEFFDKICFEVIIEVRSIQDSTLSVKINAQEPQILIGEGGKTLAEIQHLLKRVLSKGNDERFYLDLDINDYKKKKIEYLKEIALSVADEVDLTKKEKILAPMPAFERRIIHLELASRADIITESIDYGLDRRLVVKPSI